MATGEGERGKMSFYLTLIIINGNNFVNFIYIIVSIIVVVVAVVNIVFPSAQ